MEELMDLCTNFAMTPLGFHSRRSPAGHSAADPPAMQPRWADLKRSAAVVC